MKRTYFTSIFFSIVLICSCGKEETPQPDPGPVNPGSFSIKVIEDNFEDRPLVLVGSSGRNFVVAFHRELNGELLTFSPVEGKLPVVMEDQKGNRWDVFGMAVSGPDLGAQLEYVNSGMGFWFIFGAVYPGLEIFGQGEASVDLDLDTVGNWDVPVEYLAQGTGFDGIAALESPEFMNFDIVTSDPENDFFLDDEDLVIVVSINGESKVYPHAILDWHEIINDEVGGVPVSVTYCPLTGTAKVWKRSGNTIEASFGVSGLIYNSNLIPFDRSTESFWLQLEGVCINGFRRGERLELVPFLETSWLSLRSFDSSPLLMTEDTGIDRDYSQYPYGSYRTSDLISYPVTYRDERLPVKERVFSVIINGKAKVYQLEDFL